MKNIIALLIALCPLFLMSADFYWVNGSGNWTDTNHWATTSGGSIKFNHIPTKNDNVFFDSLSFSANGQTVTVNTSSIICNNMDWSEVLYKPTFYSTPNDTLNVCGSLYFSNNMSNNFYGSIKFNPSANNVCYINLNGNKLKNHCYILGDSCVLQNQLEISKNLYFSDGILNSNGYNIICNNFNPDSSFKVSFPIDNPKLYGTGSFIIGSSLFMNTQFENHFSGSFIFKASTIDTNYINLGGFKLSNNCYFEGNGLIILRNDFETSQNIYFNLGKLVSNDFNLSCFNFNSISSYARTLDFGQSIIDITGYGNAWQISTSFLNFDASNAQILFSYTGNDTVVFNPSSASISYNIVEFNCQKALINQSGNYQKLILNAGTEAIFKQNTEQKVSDITANGTCGNYIFIHSDEKGKSFSFTKTSGSINLEYIRLIDTEAKGGATFNALNSLNEGQNIGWIITIPNNNQSMYWVGGTGNWSDVSHWSYTSGGNPASCLPGPSNPVSFDANSFVGDDSVYIDRNAFCKHMVWENITTSPTLYGSGNFIQINGSLVFDKNVKALFTGNYYLESTNSDSIFTDSNIINGDIYINNGSYKLSSDVASNSDINFVKGELDFEGNTLLCQHFISKNSETRLLKLDSSIITLNGIDTVWDLNSNNLDFSANSSTIILNSQQNQEVVFKSVGLNYDNLWLETSHTKLMDSDSFKMIASFSGKSLTLEAGASLSVDSIYLNSNCANTFTLKTDNIFGDSAMIKKTGAPVLNLSHIILDNICADTNGGVVYNATEAIQRNKTAGWSITGLSGGQTFYWIGNGGNWSDTNHWSLTSGGLHFSCLPNGNDTVVFDSNSFSIANQEVIVDMEASMKALNFETANQFPKVKLNQDIYVSGNLILNPEMEIYSENIQANINLTSDTFAVFDPNGIESIDANIIISIENDSLVLGSDLNMNASARLTFTKGIFNTNNKDIKTGSVLFITDDPKDIYLTGSEITLNYGWNIFVENGLNLHTDSSTLNIKAENLSANFYGNGEKYHHVRFSSLEKATVNIYGNNTFDVLEFGKGLDVVFEKGQSQTVMDSIVSMGTCNAFIQFASTENSVAAKINLANNAKINGECMEIQDIEIDGNLKPFVINFSKDQGNNIGWSFSANPATTSKFSVDYNQCFGDTILFENLSSAFSGDSSDLSFEWYFDDGDTLSSIFDTSHYFDTKGKHIITLKSTYTNECSDEYSDSVYIKKPELIIDTDEPDFRICETDTVGFFALGTGDSFQFYIDNMPVTNFQSDTFFITNLLQDGQVAKAIVMDGGCVSESSNEITFTVDSIPNISLACSDLDQHICVGDTVLFSALGSNFYQFYINGIAQGSMDTSNVLIATNLQDGDSISVSGKYAENGCFSECGSSFIINVHDLPTVTIATTDLDKTICSGDTVGFYASGANTYQFYIDNNPQTTFDTASFFETVSLTYSSDVYAVGQSVFGCKNQSNTIGFVVNPVPNTTLSCSDQNQDICQGEVVTFNASGASLYEFFIDGNSQGSPSSLNFKNFNSLNDNQTVTVKGYINACSAYSNSFYTFSVHPNVKLNCSDADQIICDGNEVTFTASGDSLYQFLIDNQIVSAYSSNNSYTINNLKDGQMFSVKASTGACLPNPMQFTVNPLPAKVELLCSDDDQLICEGDKVTFTTNGASQYEYFIDSVSQGSPVTNTSFSKTNIVNGQSIYVLGYTDKGCPKNSQTTYSFVVNPYPTVTLASSDLDKTICSGDSVKFTSSGADSFMFMLENNILRDFSTTPDFSTNQLVNGKEFYVIGKSQNCSAKSDSSFKFRVFNIPMVQLVSNSDFSLCDGDSINVVASGADNYEFFIDNNSQGFNSKNTLNLIPTTNQIEIKVKGESNGCANFANSILNYQINEYPIVGFVSDDIDNEICYGENIEFKATGAETYEFYNNGLMQGLRTSDSIFTPNYLENGDEISVFAFNANCGVLADSIYKITVHKMDIGLTNEFNSNLICESSSITFTATGGDEYQFFIDGNAQGNLSSVDNFIATTLADGQIVEVKAKSLTTGCLQNSDISYRMKVMDSPNITANSSTTFCKGDSVILISNYKKGNQWFKDGILMSNKNEPSIVVRNTGNYNLMVKEGGDGNLVAFGNNSHGQLGNSSTINSLEAVDVSGISNIKEIAGGNGFNMALDADGNVFSWGNNSKGQLGDATYSDKYVPIKINSLNQIANISAGNEHSLALKSDSTVLSWGNNIDGQLGYGNNAVSNFPLQVADLKEIVKISAGEKHSLALKSDGTVWAFGDNRFGQLGDQSLTDKNKAIQVVGMPIIVDIAVGSYHNLALDQDGNVWAWGNNAKGQLGIGNLNSSGIPVKIKGLIKIIAIGAGAEHCLALKSNGQLYAWGANEKGQLGVTNIQLAKAPVLVNLDAFIAEIICGSYHNFALEADKSVWAWGYNLDGQLGNNSQINQSTPILLEQINGISKISAGTNHSVALLGISNSCTSSIIKITVDTFPDAVITYDGLKFTTVEGITYQWYFNGNEIPGATKQTYTPQAYGNYSVKVTFANNCEGFSEVFKFSSIDQIDIENHISISPNPSNGRFFIGFDLNNFYLNTIEKVNIFDAHGKLVNSIDNLYGNQIEINLQNQSKGLYLVQIISGNKIISKKVIIE